MGGHRLARGQPGELGQQLGELRIGADRLVAEPA
jgi:hypothetical protein